MRIGLFTQRRFGDDGYQCTTSNPTLNHHNKRFLRNFFFFFLFIFNILRSVSFAGFSGSVLGRWTASCPSSSGCSFPYWFPFKCHVWQSSLFHSSHVSVPISFSLSPPSYNVWHATLFPNVSIPNLVYSCFSHYSPEFLLWFLFRMSYLA